MERIITVKISGWNFEKDFAFEDVKAFVSSTFTVQLELLNIVSNIDVDGSYTSDWLDATEAFGWTAVHRIDTSYMRRLYRATS